MVGAPNIIASSWVNPDIGWSSIKDYLELVVLTSYTNLSSVLGILEIVEFDVVLGSSSSL